jgi:hypothetical protein
MNFYSISDLHCLYKLDSYLFLTEKLQWIDFLECNFYYWYIFQFQEFDVLINIIKNFVLEELIPQIGLGEWIELL